MGIYKVVTSSNLSLLGVLVVAIVLPIEKQNFKDDLRSKKRIRGHW